MQKFADYLRVEKRYSSHTLLAYETDLNQFASYLKEVYEVDSMGEVRPSFVRSWLVKLMEEGITARSVNRKITALKSFYKFAVRKGHLHNNPMLKVSSPKTSRRLPEYVEAEKLDLLLDNTEFPDNFDGRRDHLIIELFYGTGIRLSELLGLHMDDIQISRHQIRVTGKRNKQRIIPLFTELESKIEHYLIDRKSVESETPHVFVFESGHALYPMYVYRLVNKYLSLVSTRKKKSPHVLRHSFATEMLNKGADLNAIKELLGHANLSATQVYTHNTIEKLKKAYNLAHPRA
ncbi:MAG: tyrosine-type recombinase/integrase [Bacteroidetes bacterium]|nr:tyrosine-type recombinase/integrase [Bacteroidota bacterium]